MVLEMGVAHQFQSDHKGLVLRVREYLMEVGEIAESFALATGKYLITNLKENIQVVNSMSCLPVLYQHLNFNAKTSFTSLLR